MGVTIPFVKLAARAKTAALLAKWQNPALRQSHENKLKTSRDTL